MMRGCARWGARGPALCFFSRGVAESAEGGDWIFYVSSASPRETPAVAPSRLRVSPCLLHRRQTTPQLRRGEVAHVFGTGGAGDQATWLNLSFAVGALLCITVGTLYQKRFVQACDVRTANTVQLIAAFIVTLPLALLEPEPMHYTGEFIGAMAWSVLGLTLGGSSLLYMLIQRGAAASVTSLMYLVPPCTALIAWLLFAEPITASTLLGIALTALGVSLVVRASR